MFKVTNWTDILTAENLAVLFVASLVLAWAIVVVGWSGWAAYKYVKTGIARFKRNRRDRKMRQDLEKKESALIADLLTETLENAVYDGRLSDERRNFWYNRLGNVLNIPDLLPKGRKTLKKRIQDRLKSKNGSGKPVKIPGEAPIQEVKSNKFSQTSKGFNLFK